VKIEESMDDDISMRSNSGDVYMRSNNESESKSELSHTNPTEIEDTIIDIRHESTEVKPHTPVPPEEESIDDEVSIKSNSDDVYMVESKEDSDDVYMVEVKPHIPVPPASPVPSKYEDIVVVPVPPPPPVLVLVPPVSPVLVPVPPVSPVLAPVPPLSPVLVPVPPPSPVPTVMSSSSSSSLSSLANIPSLSLGGLKRGPDIGSNSLC
jgi:hypothetical protein